jgi:hypothetical protein
MAFRQARIMRPGGATGGAAVGAAGPAARGGARRETAAGRGPAHGIYGTIVTASVMASAGDELTTPELIVSILVTLAVYWFADVYSEMLGHQLQQEHLPSWRDAGAGLAAAWPMVSASFIPLVVLGLASLTALSDSWAATAGLIAAIVMLAYYAWSAGRAARLHGARLAVVTGAAALLGVLMVVLKNVVLVQLH